MKDRRPGTRAVIRIVFVVTYMCGAGSALVAHAPSNNRAAVSQSSPSFLGFGLGEERRYVLGPAEELYSGEGAMWSIRLRELMADPPDAVFELSHEWGRAEYRSEPPIGTPMRVSSSGELRVNAHGFPLDLSFRTERHLYGLGEQAYTVRYLFEHGDFRKFFSVGSSDFDHPVRVRRTDGLDVSAPRGMWAHAPMALECMFSLPPSTSRSLNPVQTPAPTAGSKTGGIMPAAPLRIADQVDCREPLFANPGLLSLMLPALWEAGTGELDFLMLTPAGDFGMPSFSGGGGSVGGFGRISGGAGSRHFESERATRAQTNSEVENLRYVDRVRVSIGRRMIDAWRFEGMRAFDAVFVDDDGVVLRVDLAASISTWPAPLDVRSAPLEPTRMDNRGLWIRLLFPSEY